MLAVAVLACAGELTEPEIGQTLRCQKTVAAVEAVAVKGDSRTHRVEVGVCSYPVDLPRPSTETDTLIIKVPLAAITNKT